MQPDDWWGLIDRARTAVGERADDRDSPDDPLPGALIDVLAALEPARIIDFSVTAVRVTDSAYRYPLWNAAYLIEGGCGDKPAGESWDVEDDDEMRRRLPRLSALFLDDGDVT